MPNTSASTSSKFVFESFESSVTRTVLVGKATATELESASAVTKVVQDGNMTMVGLIERLAKIE